MEKDKKNSTENDSAKKKLENTDLYNELSSHFQKWQEDNDQRRNRKGGWDDVTKAYWGKLPEDWPYITRVVDPRIRTSLIEKDARLLNKKPRGKVIPRGNGATSVKAAVQNAVLSFQWDNADHGGSMQEKLIICSQDARLYASKFALVTWKEDINKDGETVFSGNEMEPLDIRDCGMDFSATHIRDAKWFQHRKWMFIEDLEEENKVAGKTIWKNIKKIKGLMNDPKYLSSDRRDNVRVSVVKSIQGLTDRVGEDKSYPMLEVVTEYREDKWVSFCPKYQTIIRDIKNPFKHGKIPISQLRYYPVQDDSLGESEVESVVSLWKAIQAVVCGYLDEAILKMRPPLKIVEGAARLETIEYGPEAQWMVDNQDAVQEMRSNGEAQRWFQTTYAALVSAFNTAMGDMSQNISNVDTFSSDKTATEIKATTKQQNARDQRNQNELSDFIRDIILMWISNNRQFLFSDPSKKFDIVKLVGIDQYEEFKKMGLADKSLSDEGMTLLQDTLEASDFDVSDKDLQSMFDAASVPQYPVLENPEERDISKLMIRPKLEISERENSADLYVTPTDFDGDYDFIVDVKSMEVGAEMEYIQSRQQAISMMKDQTLLGLLREEGWKPKVRDLLVSVLNEGGLNDSQRYFERAEVNPVQGTTQGAGGAQPNQGVGGLPTGASPQAQVGPTQPMA